MLKNKLFFFYFFIFAFYVESFAMLENSSSQSPQERPFEENKRNISINEEPINTDNKDQNIAADSRNKDNVKYFLEPSKQPSDKNFNKLAHIFFYFVISPLLNVNNLDWRHYFFQGQLNRGGVFFYYGLLNFGIGFNRKTFWDTCSCRIVGLNLLQFLGSFFLYFFVDGRQKIVERWEMTKSFLCFLLFNDAYFKEHIENIDSKSIPKNAVQLDSFMKFMCYSFSIFPFLSVFTFDFQLFEYLSFSLNIGSFLFLTVAFAVYTFYKHNGKPSGFVLNVVKKYHNTLKDSKDANINIQLIDE